MTRRLEVRLCRNPARRVVQCPRNVSQAVGIDGESIVPDANAVRSMLAWSWGLSEGRSCNEWRRRQRRSRASIQLVDLPLCYLYSAQEAHLGWHAYHA
jgi:hypothetical protein